MLLILIVNYPLSIPHIATELMSPELTKMLLQEKNNSEIFFWLIWNRQLLSESWSTHNRTSVRRNDAGKCYRRWENNSRQSPVVGRRTYV